MKKRILVLLSAVALMVVMLAMSVAPAFALADDDQASCRGQAVSSITTTPPPGSEFGEGTALAADQYQEGGTNNYGVDWTSTQALGTNPYCSLF